jgi:hypothetical protein
MFRVLFILICIILVDHIPVTPLHIQNTTSSGQQTARTLKSFCLGPNRHRAFGGLEQL